MKSCVLFLTLLLLSIFTADAWKPHRAVKAALKSTVLPLALILGNIASADDKLRNLDDAKILSIVSEDITERQALASADFTRAIYSEDCTFTDEIDTYKIDEYVKGTKALFNARASKVDLASTPVIQDNVISYRFKETLAFKVPLNPKVDLSGRVELRRGPDGLIVTSREFWDDGVAQVLQHVYF